MKKILLLSLSCFLPGISLKAQDKLIAQHTHFYIADESTWYDLDSIVYTYDSFGREATSTSYQKDALNNYQPLGGTTHKYYNLDGTLNMEVVLYYNIDHFDSSYVMKYTYDGNKRRTHTALENKVPGYSTNDWHLDIAYDGNGNKISETYEKWNTASSNWKKAGDLKSEYTYDNNGYLNTATHSVRDSNLTTYHGLTKTSFTNTMNGMVTQRIMEFWENNNWKYTYKDSLVYNGSDQLIENYQSAWMAGWINYFKTTTSYNGNGKDDTTLSQNWVDSITAYVNSTMELRTYDNYGNLVDLSSKIWDNDNSEWLIYEQSSYYYSSGSTSINTAENSANIFPNPFNNVLNIDNTEQINSLKIFDLTGKEVSVNIIQNHKRISIPTENLTAGIYLVQLNSNSGSKSFKVVKN